MNPIELIILGVFAIVVAPAVLAPLVWAAVLDGRYHARQQRRFQPASTLVAPQPRGQRANPRWQAWWSPSLNTPVAELKTIES